MRSPPYFLYSDEFFFLKVAVESDFSTNCRLGICQTFLEPFIERAGKHGGLADDATAICTKVR